MRGQSKGVHIAATLKKWRCISLKYRVGYKILLIKIISFTTFSSITCLSVVLSIKDYEIKLRYKTIKIGTKRNSELLLGPTIASQQAKVIDNRRFQPTFILCCNRPVF